MSGGIAIIEHMFERRSVHESLFGLAVLGDIERKRAALAAAEADVLVALAGPEPRECRVVVHDPDTGTDRGVVIPDIDIELIATHVRRSPVTVRRQVEQARLLRRSLPGTHAALAAGRISGAHAEVIARTAHDLPTAVLPAFEREVLARACALTSGETATLARRVRARLDREGEEARRAAARRHEDVRVWVEGDGLACLMARLPIADAARVHEAIQARAREVEVACDATVGQRRVRGLIEAVCGIGDSGSTGVQVLVTVDLATLAGLADAAALVRLGHGAPEPITATALRDLLSDPAVPATLRRLVTDPATGALVDRGREAYRVTDSLRAFLVTRDGTCRFPGCSRSATTCDVDHAVPWGDGGSTDRSNLGPLCRRHHLLKTHGGWSIEHVEPDGRTIWRAPDDRRVVFHPFPVADPPIGTLTPEAPKPPPPASADPPF